MREFFLGMLLAAAVAAPAHPQTTTSLESRVAGLEAELSLRDADGAIAMAERDLADAELRYSAARTGQARKGRGNPLSIGNPGSRKRWDEAVAQATAQVEAAKLRREQAVAARAALVVKLCGERLLARECVAAPEQR